MTITEKFRKCLKFTLKWEGLIADDPNDRGGLTNAGITHTVYDNYRKEKGLPLRSVREMTPEERDEIYHIKYWNLIKSEELCDQLALVMFDTAVNFGVGNAISFFQEYLGISPWTYTYDNNTWSLLKKNNNKETALGVLKCRRNYRYTNVQSNPSQSVFLDGWINRDDDLRKEVLNMMDADTPKPPINIVVDNNSVFLEGVRKGIRNEVLRVALLELPKPGEDPNMEIEGPNSGPKVRKYLSSVGITTPAAWCMGFVYYCVKSLYDRFGPMSDDILLRTGYCPHTHDWALGKNILKLNPTKGDIFLIYFTDDLPDHTGFVTEVLSDTEVRTLEGNTNKLGSPEGQGIYVKNRPIRQCRFVSWWKNIDIKDCTIQIKGKDKVYGVEINNTVYGPARFICDKLGITLGYDSKENKLTLGENTKVSIPFSVDGSSWAPVRSIVRNKLNYDSKKRILTVE